MAAIKCRTCGKVVDARPNGTTEDVLTLVPCYDCQDNARRAADRAAKADRFNRRPATDGQPKGTTT